MSSLTVFAFNSQEIRFVEGKPVASDVAKALGYVDPQSTISKKVSLKNKGVAKMATPGGEQSVIVLEEAGIYQLIFSSKLESAQQFQEWVFEEVLPSIRKTGKYQIDQSPQLPSSYKEALLALIAKEEEREKLEKEAVLLKLQNDDLEGENIRLSEVVDELFGYSSILRIAKFNGVSEKLFSWRLLKIASQKMNLEVKQVPCPRFVTKNLYSHDAWRYCYPNMRLPETTTLVIRP